MKAENSVTLKCSLYDFGPGTKHPHPKEFFNTLAPSAVNRKWVPQTLGEQIWLLYEFASPAERDAFVGGLPTHLRECVDDEGQEHYDHWA